MQSDGLLSRAAAAAYIGVSERSISNIEDRGELTAVRIGNRTLFKKDDLDALVRSRQSHRADVDIAKFQVEHELKLKLSGQRDKYFVLRSDDSRELTLSHEQFKSLVELFRSMGGLTWSGDQLSHDDVCALLRKVGWLGKVITFLGQSPGLTVQCRIS